MFSGPWTIRGSEWKTSCTGRFNLEGRAPFTLCIGGWVGLTADMNVVTNRKITSLVVN